MKHKYYELRNMYNKFKQYIWYEIITYIAQLHLLLPLFLQTCLHSIYGVGASFLSLFLYKFLAKSLCFLSRVDVGFRTTCFSRLWCQVKSNLINTTPSILQHIFARPHFRVQNSPLLCDHGTR